MKIEPRSIRPFIGSSDYSVSRAFYSSLGFEESIVSEDMSLFSLGTFSFYLQDAYEKKWIENSMIFLEVENLEDVFQHMQSLKLDSQYRGVRISRIHYNEWGNEFFVHDPSGVLWHVGEFK